MIKVICVGKIKEEYLKDAIKEYEKRLSKYTKLEIVEVLDFSYDSKEQEANLILKHIREKDYVITLEIEGKNMSSIQFSNYLDDIKMKNPNIIFVIGGSNGLGLEVKKRSNEAISFSSFTFPHQLFRVILLEQIYRAFKISNNESYHK